MRTNFIIIFFFISIGFMSGQSKRALDSLYSEIKNSKADTSLVKLQIELSFQWRVFDMDSAILHADKAKELAENCAYEYGEARAVFAKGFAYYAYHMNNEALVQYEKALEMFEEQKRNKDIIKMCINMGVIYSANNNTKALEVYYRALKILEGTPEDKLMALTLGNIGTIHYYIYEYDKAIEFCSKALEIDKRLNNMPGVARNLGNMGTYYIDKGVRAMKSKDQNKEAKGLFAIAIKNLSEAYDLCEKNGDKNGMAMNMGNIASGFCELGDTLKALEYYNKAYKLDEELRNKLGMSRHLGNIGYMYLGQKKYDKAEDYLKRALILAQELNNFPLLCKWHVNLHSLYEETGKFELALKHFKQNEIYKDSLYSIENTKKNVETEMNFEFQKKENEAKEESARQAIIRNVFIGGFVVVLLMGILVLRSYRIKQKANKIVSQQKELLEVKNKEITDSIQYAKRIQNAHLPSTEYISKKLKELKKKT